LKPRGAGADHRGDEEALGSAEEGQGQRKPRPKTAAPAVKPAAALKRPVRKAAAKTTKPAICHEESRAPFVVREVSRGEALEKRQKVQEPQVVGPARRR